MNRKLLIIGVAAFVVGVICGCMMTRTYLPGPQPGASVSSSSHPDEIPFTRRELPEPVLPAKTPFDGDDKKRDGYLYGYSRGYGYATGIDARCPTNPGAYNLFAIRGWVEGWQAGVQAGGKNDLPARYASFLVWGDDKLGRDEDR